MVLVQSVFVAGGGNVPGDLYIPEREFITLDLAELPKNRMKKFPAIE